MEATPIDHSQIELTEWPTSPNTASQSSGSLPEVPTAESPSSRPTACPYGFGNMQLRFAPLPIADSPSGADDADELARTNAMLLRSTQMQSSDGPVSDNNLYAIVEMAGMAATQTAVAIPVEPNDPFTTADAIPDTVERWTSDTPEHGGFHRQQRINPLAYVTILGALAITAVCAILESDVLPDHVIFTYIKLLASPFSTIFAAIMTFMFNDMHGFDLSYDAGTGDFTAKRFTALTRCCGPRIRHFAATDVYGLRIIYPCGSPDRAVLVFETTKGDIPVARQAHCCRCNVEELTIEAEFWVRVCHKHGVASEFFGVQVNKILPAMF